MSDPDVASPGGGVVRATQVGSWPGRDVETAQRIAFAEAPDLPCLVELPDRGPGAGLVGRGIALLTDIPVDRQPSGWRVSVGAAGDQRIARALFRDDLDRLEEAAQGYQGPVKIAVAGPWTLAAAIEQSRGEKLVADHGARKELGESLAQGLADLAGELARRLPDVAWWWQLDEPMLPLVAGGDVRTASGLSRLRPIELPELVTGLDGVLAALDGPCWVHCCHEAVPWEVLLRSSARGVSVDAALVDAAGWDVLGPAVEQGRTLALGVAPTSGPVLGPDALAHAVLRRWEPLGLPPERAGQVWLTPTCGLAGRTEADAVATLRALHRAAAIVTEELASG